MDDLHSDPLEDEAPRRDDGRERTAADIVRLAGLWLGTFALLKLFKGSPNDLPAQIKDWLPSIDLLLKFRAAVAVELVLFALALFRPQFAWLPLVLLFGFFDFLLWEPVRTGAESCGCGGSIIKLNPKMMMAIDSTLLLAMLVSRPWKLARGSRTPLSMLVMAGLIGTSLWAPWHFFEVGTLPPPAAQPASNPTSDGGDTDTTDEGGGAEAQPEAPSTDEPDPPVEVVVEEPQLPQYHLFDPKAWTGQDVFSIDLASFMETALLPPDCHVVFYRQQCDHCAEHLQKMTMEPAPAVPVVLIRVPEDGDSPDNEVTKTKPVDHIPMELPELARGYGMDTPVTMEVAGSTVGEVKDRYDLEEGE